MSLFTKSRTNKTKKSQKTTYSCGNRYTTTCKTLKGGYTKITTKPSKPRKK